MFENKNNTIFEITAQDNTSFLVGLDGSYRNHELLTDVVRELLVDTANCNMEPPKTGYEEIVAVKVFPDIGPAFYLGIPVKKDEVEDMDEFVDSFLQKHVRSVQSWELAS